MTDSRTFHRRILLARNSQAGEDQCSVVVTVQLLTITPVPLVFPRVKTTGVCGFVSLRSMAQTSMIRRFLKNYLPRHRNRTNQFLHMIGVPLTFIGTPVAIAQGVEWYWPFLCFLGGYGLQFAGHAVEGNDAGEIVFLKKTLGMPYTEYGPQSEYSRGPEQHDDRTSG